MITTVEAKNLFSSALNSALSMMPAKAMGLAIMENPAQFSKWRTGEREPGVSKAIKMSHLPGDVGLVIRSMMWPQRPALLIGNVLVEAHQVCALVAGLDDLLVAVNRGHRIGPQQFAHSLARVESAIDKLLGIKMAMLQSETRRRARAVPA